MLAINELKIKNTLIYTLLSLSALILFFPILYAISASFMSTREILNGGLLPRRFSFENYITAMTTAPLLKFFFNSMIISLTGMTLQILTCSMGAYAITFMEFRSKKLITAILLGSMLIPWDAILIPNYTNIISWGLLNTRAAMILPFITNGLGIFLMLQYFKTINTSLVEAAKIDGANHLKIYYHVVLPVSKPILSTWGIYSFLAMWNMYLWPLMATTRPEARTIQIGLTMLKVQEGGSGWGMLMAAVVLVILPPLSVVFIGQKQLQKGLTSGAVKG